MNEIYEFEGRFPRLLVLWLVLAAVLLVLGVAFSPTFAVLASIPIAIAATSFISRIKPNRFEVNDLGLVNQANMKSISFADINGVWNAGANLVNHRLQLSDGWLIIEHTRGTMELYDRDFAKLASFADLILSRVKPMANNSIKAPFVNQYLMEVRSSFGENLITVCQQAQSNIPRGKSRNIAGALALVSIVMAVILWFVFGFTADVAPRNDPEPAVILCAVHASIFSIIGFISLVASFTHRNKHAFVNSAIVISPRGFALAQKNLDGSITWNEVKNVKKNRMGLIVSVAGATIVITDVYDLPINQIYDLMKSNLV